MMIQVLYSPPSLDALQSARLVRLLAGSASRRRPRQQPPNSSWCRTRGVLERWKKGEDRLAGGRWTRAPTRTGTPALLPSWFQYIVLSTCSVLLFRGVGYWKFRASFCSEQVSASFALIWCPSSEISLQALQPCSLSLRLENMGLSRNFFILLT